MDTPAPLTSAYGAGVDTPAPLTHLSLHTSMKSPNRPAYIHLERSPPPPPFLLCSMGTIESTHQEPLHDLRDGEFGHRLNQYFEMPWTKRV